MSVSELKYPTASGRWLIRESVAHKEGSDKERQASVFRQTFFVSIILIIQVVLCYIRMKLSTEVLL